MPKSQPQSEATSFFKVLFSKKTPSPVSQATRLSNLISDWKKSGSKKAQKETGDKIADISQTSHDNGRNRGTGENAVTEEGMLAFLDGGSKANVELVKSMKSNYVTLITRFVDHAVESGVPLGNKGFGI